MYIHVDISIVIQIRVQVHTIRLLPDVHLHVRRKVLFGEQYVADQRSVVIVVVFALLGRIKRDV